MPSVDEPVRFSLKFPEVRNRGSWFSLLKKLSERFTQHAVGINALYNDFVLNTEYVLADKSWNGAPIYFKVIDMGYGGAGTPSVPTTNTVAHGVTGMLIDPAVAIYWSRMQTTVYTFGGGGASYNQRQRITGPAGAIDEWFITATNINWRVNYNAVLFRGVAYLEYQRT